MICSIAFDSFAANNTYQHQTMKSLKEKFSTKDKPPKVPRISIEGIANGVDAQSLVSQSVANSVCTIPATARTSLASCLTAGNWLCINLKEARGLAAHDTDTNSSDA